MRLKKVRVTNFRSIEDSGEFEVDDVLCLVGKNEAGKSAILHALAGLNPHPATLIEYDAERDYPRRFWSEYASRHGGEEAEVISTQWELSEEEMRELRQELGPGVLTSNIVVISRSYESPVEWRIPIDYGTTMRWLINLHGLSAGESHDLQSASNSDQLRKALEGLPERTESQEGLLNRLNSFPDKSIRGKATSILSGYLPRFMYFAHYDRMVGQIRIDTFEARQKGQAAPRIDVGEQVFIDFLEYAGTSLAEILAATTYEGLNARCEAASNRITEQLLDYWTQNPYLEIDVRVTKAEPADEAPFNAGVVARARVKNTLHKVTVPFSERSAGFIWFFSFLVKFAQVSKEGGNLILLLDEPGLTLHGKAQADLLRYFEEQLAPKHQIIFSTHSPFMVPADDLLSVRIVEDKVTLGKSGRPETHGSKVRSDVLSADRDTLFPLQGALGYEITQSLFIGKHTLLVEGPGDILALQAFSSALKRAGIVGLNPHWTLCPAGGIDKVQPFVSLFSSAKLNIAVLTDFSKADQRKLDALIKNQIMQSDHVLTYAGLLRLDEADLEDVLDPRLYLHAVNEAYKLKGSQALTIKKLDAVELPTKRLVKRVEALFKLLPPETPEFDHFTPMEWLFLNPKVLDSAPGAAETHERAKAVISAINALPVI